MRRHAKTMLVALFVAGATAVSPVSVEAKSAGSIESFGGVTVAGSPYRYIANSPNRFGVYGMVIPGKTTTVAKVSRQGGRVSRWWYLRGSFGVPAASYDLDSGTGLSGDGSTLVLRRSPGNVYPPHASHFAALYTGSGANPLPEPINYISLDGDLSVYAISPDGSTLYLTRRLPGKHDGSYIADHVLVSLDLTAENSKPRNLSGPAGRTGGPEGVPISRAASSDGRWAYTLYTGYSPASGGGNPHRPFVEALDTVSGETRRTRLPQLDRERNPMMLKLRVEGDDLTIARTDSSPLLRLSRADVEAGTDNGAAVFAATQRFLTPPDRARVSAPGAHSNTRPVTSESATPAEFLSFTQSPRGPYNLLARHGTIGRSARGRPIAMQQLGDPAIDGEVLVFGCTHGDECAARRIEPLWNGCPDTRSDIYLVRNLNPDGLAEGTRLNGHGVDLNRNFATAWKPIGVRGGAQYAGPRPFSEPESRLAAKVIRKVEPEVTIWFHQLHGDESYVRAWGDSVPAARRFATLAGLEFRRMPWLAGTAPNWQNRHFPGTASFVVEFPRGPISGTVMHRLGRATVQLGREVGKD